MKILITGASGFIGSFLCEEALRQGMETWAGMREHSSRRWLQQEALNFAFLDLTSPEVLSRQLSRYKEKVVRWDVIIHAGGATKCLRREDFDLHNFVCTKNLVETLSSLDMLPQQFLYVSSHSAETKTAYGISKKKSEEWLKQFYETNIPHGALCPSEGVSGGLTIFRPTGVYGPREKDYFMMAKSIKQHIDFAVGFKPQVLTFVYARDLVTAIFSAIGKADIANGKTYAVSDGAEYSSRAFSDLIQSELGVKHVLHITAPLWFLRLVCAVCEGFSKLTGKPATLNGDKYIIMSQRDWSCDITPIQRDLGFVPQWQLPRGVKECMQWYKDHGWL